MNTRLTLAFGLLLLGGCGFAPKPENGLLPCDKGCPDGYVCRADNRCWLPGTPVADSAIGQPPASHDGSIWGTAVDVGAQGEVGKDVAMDGPGAVDSAAERDGADTGRYSDAIVPAVDVPEGTGGGMDSGAGGAADDRPAAEDLVPDLARVDTATAPDVPPPDTPGPDAPTSNVDAPLDSPATCPYACCADSDCPGTCQTCDTSHTCVSVVSRDDPNGRCAGTCDATGACKAKQGQACTAVPGGCIAGTSCADGYCCNRACSDACEACDVSGLLGTCTTLAAGASPRSTHTPCANSVPACAGTCNGTSASCFYNSGPCGSPSCTGSTYQAAGTCSDGFCNYPSPQACQNGQVCAGAACACAAPRTTCSGTLCVDLQSDPAHCGDCARSCSSNHGSSSCTAGSCQMSCAGDYRDCSTNENVALDGCETNVLADLNNCGTCGNICPNDWAHATPSCGNKTCGHACTAPWENCDGLATNGCETNLEIDGGNCGTCAKTCDSTVCRARTCLTTTKYGNTGAGTTTSSFGKGTLAGIQIYVSTASVITGFGVVIHSSGTARSMYLGLYRDVAGSPGGLVATVSEPFTALPSGTEVSVAAQVDILPGNYWLLGTWNDTAKFASNSTTPVNWLYATHGFGPLPASAPAMAPSSAPAPNLYVIVAQ